MKKYIPIAEAATAIGKSKRTIQRYLSKMSSSDKKKFTRVTDGKTLVSTDWVNSLNKAPKQPQNKHKRQNKASSATDDTTHHDTTTDDTKNVIEELKAEVKELKQTVKEKDKQLIAKDALIEQNINDFKLLTSKVLYLSEENQKLAEAPKKEDDTTTRQQEEEQESVRAKIEFLSIAIGIAITLLAFILVYEFFIK